jgi:cob(I)alamin adenosyltransferase
MKIYTKTGDKGETSLVEEKEFRKNSIRVESYGT